MHHSNMASNETFECEDLKFDAKSISQTSPEIIPVACFEVSNELIPLSPWRIFLFKKKKEKEKEKHIC